MRIAHLVVENFRSIEKLEMDVPAICSLVGANNAGKSNILLAIQRVMGKDWLRVDDFDEGDVFQQNPDADIRIRVSLEPAIQYSKLKNAQPVEIHALDFAYTRYKGGTQKRRLDAKCLGADGKVPLAMATYPKKGEKPKFEPILGIPSDVREQIPLIHIGARRSLQDQLPAARFSLLRRMFEDVNDDFNNPLNTISIKRAGREDVQVPRQQRYEQLMAAAVALLRTKDFSDLEESIRANALRALGLDPSADADRLQLFFSPIGSMEFYKSLDLMIKDAGVPISATRSGDGIQNALVLAILQAYEERRKKGAILLIEEPEMFLHPQMQRSLFRTLQAIAETNQVIYTTHSPHFVSVPNYGSTVLVRKEPGGSTRVRVSNLANTSQLREKLIKEFDPERNELFFARRLLLVEGDTEKLSFPEYAKRLGLDLDKAGATIVEVGGKKSLWQFARIALSFGIPTGVVYDEDSTDFKKDEKEKEAEYNKSLDEFEQPGAPARVWHFSRKFEDHLRSTLTEPVYQGMCQKYPFSKPVQARLIAMETNLGVPSPIEEILTWLASGPGAI